MAVVESTALALLMIVLVAMVVAGWEHLQLEVAARERRATSPADLEGGDRAERAAALNRTLSGMALAPAGMRRHEGPWAETRPMVNPGLAPEPALVTEESGPEAAKAPARQGARVDLLLG